MHREIYILYRYFLTHNEYHRSLVVCKKIEQHDAEKICYVEKEMKKRNKGGVDWDEAKERPV